MADFKNNPKNPNQIRIPKRIRKHFGMTEHISRMNMGGVVSGSIGKMSALGKAFTKKFYAK